MKLQLKSILFLVCINACAYTMEEDGKASAPSSQEDVLSKNYPISWHVSRKKHKTEKKQLNDLVDTVTELEKKLETINNNRKSLTNGAQEIVSDFMPFIPAIPTAYLIKLTRSAMCIVNSSGERYKAHIESINNNLPYEHKLDQHQMNQKNAVYAASLRKKMLDPYISELKNRGVSIGDSIN